MNELDQTVNTYNNGTIGEDKFLPYRRKYKLTYHLQYGLLALSIIAFLFLIFIVITYNTSDSHDKPMSYDKFIHYVIISVVVSYILTWMSCVAWKIKNVIKVKIMEQFSSRKDLLEHAIKTNKKDNHLIIACCITNASIYFTIGMFLFYIISFLFEFSDLAVDKNPDEYVAKSPANNRKARKHNSTNLTHELDNEVLHPNLVYNHV